MSHIQCQSQFIKQWFIKVFSRIYTQSPLVFIFITFECCCCAFCSSSPFFVSSDGFFCFSFHSLACCLHLSTGFVLMFVYAINYVLVRTNVCVNKCLIVCVCVCSVFRLESVSQYRTSVSAVPSCSASPCSGSRTCTSVCGCSVRTVEAPVCLYVMCSVNPADNPRW